MYFFVFFFNLKELNIILVGWGITIKYFTLTSLKDRARKVYKNIARTLLRANSVLILSLNFHILIIIAFHIMFGGTMPIFCSRCKIHFFWFIFIIILGIWLTSFWMSYSRTMFSWHNEVSAMVSRSNSCAELQDLGTLIAYSTPDSCVE